MRLLSIPICRDAGKSVTLRLMKNGIVIPPGRILLHACCAPCSGAIVEYLVEHGCRPVIFYSNSNITPREEYDIRLNECIRYAHSCGLEIVDDAYDHNSWLCCAEGLEAEPERGARCLECFKYRLLRAAQYAAANGFDVLTTTLASSRWKDLEQVNAAGEWACAQVEGVEGGITRTPFPDNPGTALLQPDFLRLRILYFAGVGSADPSEALKSNCFLCQVHVYMAPALWFLIVMAWRKILISVMPSPVAPMRPMQSAVLPS